MYDGRGVLDIYETHINKKRTAKAKLDMGQR